MNNEILSKGLRSAALLIVIVVVVWSFTLIGSPSFNRKLAADRNRLSDLKSLRDRIERYYTKRRQLPEKLTDLEKIERWYGSDSLEDSLTKKEYGYKVTGPYQFEICAEFDLTSEQATLERERHESKSSIWQHGVGNHCFPFDIPEDKRKES